MEENYEVMLGSNVTGRIQLQPDGLYIRCYCSCRGEENKIYRLVAHWEDGWENLGIPVPEGDALVLSKRIPAKRLRKKGLSFFMLEANQDIAQAVKPKEKNIESEIIPKEVETPLRETVLQDLPEEPNCESIARETESNPCETSISVVMRDGREEEHEIKKIPLDPELPCSYLEKLGQSRLLMEEEQAYLVVSSESEEEMVNESPTGQWSDPSTSG